MSELQVYASIAKIQGELAKEGISKDRKNQMQGFAYRGIDDVYAALSPLLSANRLCILPRMMGRECVERTNQKGNALFYTTVTVEFDIVSAIDGSKHTVGAYGEAMDSGDKSAGKAMSYAYKAMAFMVFAIPTEGDNDADATTHEVVAKSNTPNSVGKDFWIEANPEEKEYLNKCLGTTRDLLNSGEGQKAADFFYGLGDHEEMAAVWGKLGAQERKIIKAHKVEKE